MFYLKLKGNSTFIRKKSFSPEATKFEDELPIGIIELKPQKNNNLIALNIENILIYAKRFIIASLNKGRPSVKFLQV